MYVVKRDGRDEVVKFDKITARICKLCYGLNPEYVDPVSLIWFNRIAVGLNRVFLGKNLSKGGCWDLSRCNDI